MRRLGSVFSPVGRLGFSLACRAWGRSSGQSSWSPWVRSLPSRVLIGSLPMQVLSPRLVTPASGLATTEGCEEGRRSSSGSSTSRRSPAYAVPRSPGSSTTTREPKARGILRLSSLWRVGGSTSCGRCCVTEPPSSPALRLDIFIEILLRTRVNGGAATLYLPSSSSPRRVRAYAGGSAGESPHPPQRPAGSLGAEGIRRSRRSTPYRHPRRPPPGPHAPRQPTRPRTPACQCCPR